MAKKLTINKKSDEEEIKIIPVNDEIVDDEDIIEDEIVEDDIEIVEEIPFDAEIKKKKKEAKDLEKKLRNDHQSPIGIITTDDGKKKKITDLDILEQEIELIKCADDPIYFIENYLTIFDQTRPNGGEIVLFKLFPIQKELIESFRNNRFVITNKYRQAGISTTTCAYIAWYVMFNENRKVAIVANLLGTAESELMGDVVKFVEGSPDWLKPKIIKNTRIHKTFDNGSSLKAFAAKSGLRGYTPQLIFFDEVAHTNDAESFVTGALPALQTGGGAIYVSCVTKDTFIYTNKGIKQIKDFIPNKELGAHVIETYNILGKDKLREGNLFFNNGFVDTLKIKTKFSELESSYNHKYWAYKNKDNKYGIYKTSELEIDDYISIQYGMNVWGNNDDCSDFKPTLSKHIKNIFKPKKITPDLAYFIGLYISEGYMRNIFYNNKIVSTQITLTCGDSLKHIFDSIGFSCYYDGIHYTINSKNIGEFFEYLGFDLSKKAKEKIIPSRLLEMSRKNIIAMIQGIMDGDGYASFSEKKNTLRVGITLSSKELIDQLRVLFGNFGILMEYDERITPPTKKVKVFSKGFRIVTNGTFAMKYMEEIGFRFDRKQLKANSFTPNIRHTDPRDIIPNGREIMNKIYGEIKSYGKIKKLRSAGIKISNWITSKKQKILSSSRSTLINIIELEKNNINNDLLNELKPIINNNLYWAKIKSIEKSENWTYDFSLPNTVIEENNFHHSVIYNQILGYQTPNGFDSTFYPTAMAAKRGESEFKYVELYWFNDPRYNKNLTWVKNKNQNDEISIDDKNWSKDQRLKMVNEGFKATSPFFEAQIKLANGDLRKIAQELECSFLGSGDNYIAAEFLENIENNQLTEPIRTEYNDNNLWIFEEEEIDSEYIMGIDVSSGHGDDFSSINMLKVEKTIVEKIRTKEDGKIKKIRQNKYEITQVAEYYGKITPKNLAELAFQIGTRYNSAYCVIDLGNGDGASVSTELIDMGYQNIYYGPIKLKMAREVFGNYIKRENHKNPDGSMTLVDLLPGVLINEKRATIFSYFQSSIYNKYTNIKSKRLYDELKTFINVGGARICDHRKGAHDDSICSFALAIYVLYTDDRRNKNNKAETMKMLDTLIAINSPKVISGGTKNNIKKQINTAFNMGGNPFNPNPYFQYSWMFKDLKQR